MFLPTFLDQSVEHLLAWHVNLSHTNVNLLNTKMLYRKSVRQNYISNVKLFDRMTLVLFNRFSVKIFQQIYMCDRFTPWFSVQQICKLAKLSVQICWTNQLMVDAVLIRMTDWKSKYFRRTCCQDINAQNSCGSNYIAWVKQVKK